MNPPNGSRRFRVALSFSGSERAYVKKVASSLIRRLGKGSVFYDEYYTAEPARLNLDTHLQNIYRNNSDLIVFFASGTYIEKMWCGLDWRAIRSLIWERQSHAVFVQFKDSALPDVSFQPTDTCRLTASAHPSWSMRLLAGIDKNSETPTPQQNLQQ